MKEGADLRAYHLCSRGNNSEVRHERAREASQKKQSRDNDGLLTTVIFENFGFVSFGRMLLLRLSLVTTDFVVELVSNSYDILYICDL